MTAAARQIMPQADAPPRSTVSAKFARMARYSAAADGPNIAAAASSANIGRSQTLWGAHSAKPAMAAPRIRGSLA
jgi:hypothetical protein